MITRIIERYNLNRDLDQKDRIYLVSPQFVEEKINKVIRMTGDIGFTCKIGLFSGLREDRGYVISKKKNLQTIFWMSMRKVTYCRLQEWITSDCNKLD